MKFKGWQKMSLIEWPGKICSVVFVGGCNFRCPWCYNQDLAWHPEKLPDINEQKILDYLVKNKNLLEGVMITGGEPLRSDFLEGQTFQGLVNFIKKVKKLDLAVGIETNGSNPGAIEYLIDNKLVDYIAMDIKAPLEQEKYDQLTGANVSLDSVRDKSSHSGYCRAVAERISNGVDKIRESVKIIVEKAPDFEFRTTVVPGFLTEDDILKIVEFIKGAKRYYLQQFQPQKNWPNQPYQKDFFNKLSLKIKNYFQIFKIRT